MIKLSTPEACSATTLKIAKDLSSEIVDSMSCIARKSRYSLFVSILSSNEMVLRARATKTLIRSVYDFSQGEKRPLLVILKRFQTADTMRVCVNAANRIITKDVSLML